MIQKILKPYFARSLILFLALFFIAPLSVVSASPDCSKSGSPNACNACSPLNLSGDNEAACEHGWKAQAGGTSKTSACSTSAYPDKNLRTSCKQGWDIGDGTDPAVDCSADSCDLIAKYINPGINLLTAIFGLIAVISLIIGGIQFSTSEGDPQKASSAKNRISGTIIAIFAYALLYGFLQFLVPGGFLH
ncbi:MAG TPA: pilin [Candidatus Saccharimonadales bacterium]|nr:pilin [Candidatus Saccharimonadales bacterium]